MKTSINEIIARLFYFGLQIIYSMVGRLSVNSYLIKIGNQ